MSTVAHQPGPITREGFDRLQAELKHLATAKRLAADLDDQTSVHSPIGRALVGHRAGDTVTVDTPGGPRVVEIVAVGEGPPRAGAS